MKIRTFFIIGLAALAAGCSLTKPVVVNNTRVEKIEQGKNYNDYAVSYALPRTAVVVKVTAQKTVTKPGPFADYAERYLGVTNVPTREKNEWKISNISLSSRGEKDPANLYRISTEGESSGCNIQLDPEGVIMGVNLPPRIADINFSKDKVNFNSRELEIPGYSELTLRKNTEPQWDTSYQIVRTDTSFIRLPVLQQQVSQKTLMNQAEEAANFIMTLRERRFGLLNGEYAYADVQQPMPEGSALEVMIRELGRLEFDYVSLFVGRTFTEIYKYEYSYLPVGSDRAETADLFSFSAFSGVLPAGNSNGDPVSLMLNPIPGYAGSITTVEPGKSGESKAQTGLVYRLPGRADVSVVLKGEKLAAEKMLIAQYGIINTLPAALTGNPGIMIRLHPALGSIEGIYQKK